MNKILLGSVALVAMTASSAMAADYAPRRAATFAEPPASWTGIYIGGNVGGVWGTTDPGLLVGCPPVLGSNATVNGVVPNLPSTTGACSSVAATFATPVSATGTQPFHNHGFTGGLQVGFNYQYQWAVMGVEADFESFKTRGSANQTGTFPLLPLLTPCNVGAGGAVFGGCQYGFQEQSDGKWLTTVRGKVGAVWGNWLLYGTMGVAVAKLSFTSGFSAANCFGAAVAGGCDVSAFTVEQTKVGVAGGGGLSYMITRNWIASVEYLRVEIYGVGGDTRGFNTQGFLPPGNFTANFHYDTTFIENIVRFKLDYKL